VGSWTFGDLRGIKEMSVSDFGGVTMIVSV